jgi:hypothetical protein
VLGQIIRAALGGGENNCLIHRGIAQDVIQQAQLMASIICIQQSLRDIRVTI